MSMDLFRKYLASVTVVNINEQVRFYEMSKLFTLKSFTVMSGTENIVQERDSIKRTYPLFIMSGDSDIELSKKIAKQWHELDLGSNYSIISNAGHCANMDNAEEFNNKLYNFLEESSTFDKK